MGNFRTPGNPIKLPPSKINDFAGVGGGRGRVLKKFNERGWNISNIFFNEIYDMKLAVSGTTILRDGKRKIDNSGNGATITSLIVLNLGGKKRYGTIYGGVLDVIDIPTYTTKMLDPVVLDPAPTRTAVATEYPIHDPSEFQI